MKAISVIENLPTDDPHCFMVADLPDPAPQDQDLLVRIEAISVNPVDVKQRMAINGRLDTPRVLGWDACGTVVAAGKDASQFKPGDKVFFAGDIGRPGCYAELQVVDERIVAAAPKTLTPLQSATLPLTALAAWESLFDRLEIDRAADSDTPLLIIGGAGGLGSMAIQLARLRSGCVVITTASRPESQDWCRTMGAHHVIDHSGDIKEQLRALGYDSVPYILNCSNNLPYWEIMSDLVSPEGAICLVASTKASLNLDLFMSKSVRINWELMFTRSLYQTKRMSQQGHILTQVSEMVDAGQLRHTLTKDLGEMSLKSLTEAHKLIESGRMVGKIALSGIGSAD